MLDQNMHRSIMIRLLKDLFWKSKFSSQLGFKGGTCAYLFYDLPRFSVDLDFDLISLLGSDIDNLFEDLKEVISKHGEIKEAYIKRNTVFFLLSYMHGKHNVKIEVSTIDIPYIDESKFEVKNYLGIPMRISSKPYLFASKLVALTNRTKLAMRDVFDVHFFANNLWEVDVDVIKYWTNLDIQDYIDECIKFVEDISTRDLLAGLGELLDEKQKNWVKTSLVPETIFALKNHPIYNSKK